MQAVRRCSACAKHAAGGLVQNQEVSLLQRRGAACIRYLSTSEKRSGVQKPGEMTNPTHISLASLSVGHGLWQVEDLSHNSLIRRAASVLTDSSSSFLSQATLALTDALTDYSKAVHSRIIFQKRYLASVGKMSPSEEESLQRAISGWRSEAAERLNECKHYDSTWIKAVNLCKMAAEAAYSSGAHQASILVQTNIQVAQSQVEEARKLSSEADKKLAETKVEEIQRMAEYSAFLEGSEEHEVHEAYLRED
ncbi:diablo homolog, mitochondrial-like isoform X2 [Xiphophorus couchianus]|uniref:diablo homolog, mitochondrial-like isoform X2 n=1 Tax=Xiphophorus couchianus TaxID=32473 RepID=UPI0010166B65|nr:diablo homolog, mitochondrial-like isoform X2 [Xiphophorus couchianus]XP_027900439.1 diablo homolog, mitochondrial-like isoform X2 [Xiphophorus couchianus]